MPGQIGGKGKLPVLDAFLDMAANLRAASRRTSSQIVLFRKTQQALAVCQPPVSASLTKSSLPMIQRQVPCKTEFLIRVGK